jgi:chemosensory pili system protein ChpA (sensor histidine kinase/response regulator)
MMQSSREDLVGYFFQEVQAYIPEMKQGLTLLNGTGDDFRTLSELHRLFHNIKGAASQVYLQYLSGAAHLAEFMLEQTLEGEAALSPAMLSYLDDSVENISEYCAREKRNDGAESELLRTSLLAFREICGQWHDPAGRARYEEIARLLETDQSNPADASGQGEGALSSGPGEVSPEPLGAVVRRGQQLIAAILTEMTGDREYERVMREMERAADDIADRAKGLGMTVEGGLLRDLARLLEKACASGTAGRQDLSVVVGYFMSLLCMQIESMLLRSLESAVAGAGRVGAIGGHDFSAMLTDFISSFKLLLADSAVIDERSAARISDRLRRIEGFLQAEAGNQQETSISTGEEALLAEAFADSALFTGEAEVDALEPWPEEAGALLLDEVFAEKGASEEDEVLHEIFREECEEHLVVINRSLNSLDERVVGTIVLSADLREVIAAMRRSVHTLKGAAAMVGYGQLATCSHSLEDMLDWLYDQAGHIGPDDLRVAAAAIDLIELLAKQPTADYAARSAGLQQSIAGYLQGRIPVQPGEGEDSAVRRDEAAGTENSIDREAFAEGDLVSAESDIADLPADDAFESPSSGNIRVKIENLDEIIGIEGELVVARSSMEGILNELMQTVDELHSTQGKLRRISQELEAGFEVQSLYGFGSGTAGGEENTGRRGGGSFTEFDPLELDRYSQLNLIIRSLNEIAVDVNSIHADMAGLSSELHGQIARQQLIMGAMQDKLMRTRMTPMSSVSRAFFRTVRNTAGQLAKNVRLTVTGDDVYMDRFVWSRITDPLMHILRNCVDHGIETAAVRRQKGKPEVASIRIAAQQLGSFVVLRIADDGAGIDTARLREKLTAAGLVGRTDRLSDEELLPYLFHTGFSTRDEISQISGRGVGLDVVQRNIQELRGTVRIESQPGEGTVFELRIPITLSVNRAILITTGAGRYAIPLQDVVEIRSVAVSELAGEDALLVWREEKLPVKDLAALLQLREPLIFQAAATGNCLTLIVQSGKGHVAVVVDEVREQREIVVKNLGTHLTHVKGVSGVTILGDGSLIPVLNLSELVDAAQPAIPVADRIPRPAERESPLQVLVVDDSISVRQSISRLIKHQSWLPELAVDGVDALEKLESFRPDAIILDVEMPRMNGYEFMSILRSTEKFRELPVIMLTSRTSDKHRAKAEELGVDFYMTKPFKDETFVQLLGGIRQYRRVR